MHVSSATVRVIRRDALELRFVPLGDVAFALVELPQAGSAGTSLEQVCTESHWGVVLSGSMAVHRGDERLALPAGTAFHIPGGTTEHRLYADGVTSFAGFVPLAPAATDAASQPLVLRADDRDHVARGRIAAEAARMGDWLFSRARFGRTSGFVTSWCDAEHYGMVVEGDLAIEWEDDVEVIAAGDVYHCPPGPPGHRFQVADAATVVDFTPCRDVEGAGRLADWRRRAVASITVPGGSPTT